MHYGPNELNCQGKFQTLLVVESQAPIIINCYNGTCIKRPLIFVVSQDRWSFMTGKKNMIL